MNRLITLLAISLGLLVPVLAYANTGHYHPPAQHHFRCVSETQECPAGQHFSAGDCVDDVPTCEAGETLVENECVPVPPVCVLPQILQGGVCITPSPVCVLPQVLQEGICVTPPLVCTENQTPVDGACVDNPPVDPVCSESSHLNTDTHQCVDNEVTPPGGGGGSGGDNPPPPPPSGGGGNGPIAGSLPNPNNGGGNGPPIAPPINDGGGELPAGCSPLITHYLRFGRSNNTLDVIKLQTFLDLNLGLTVPVSGTFDLATVEAVKVFQNKYSVDILAPWIPFGGLLHPTGIVYITTRHKINLLYCASFQETLPPLIPWSQAGVN